MLLQDLRALAAVVDEGSFTKAALRLNLSQPAVTKQVQRLEEALGQQLIDRTHRGESALTDAGQIVYSHAKRMLRLLQQCESALAALKLPGSGHLNIGAVHSIVLFTLPRLLGEYRAKHPLVTLHVQTAVNHEILDDVLHNEIDIGLCTVPMTHEQVETIPLFYDRVVLIAAPASTWAEAGRIDTNELSQAPMLGYQRGSRFREFVDTSFENAGITPNVVMEFDSHEAIKTMVQLGFGMAMLPLSAVQDDIDARRLSRVEIEDFVEIGRTTSLLVRHDHPKTPAFTAFLTQAAHTFPFDRTRDLLY